MSIASFGILCFSSLFTVIDPIAAAPMFASLTKGTSREATRSIAIRACLVGLGVIFLFAVSGAFVFRLFGITIDAFRIGGGIVFFTLAMPMLAGTAHDEKVGPVSKDPSIVPLGVPLIGGPGAITTVMVLMGQTSSVGHVAVLLLALVFAMLATFAVLLVSPFIMRRLGTVGLELVTKVMGLIILVIGIQFIVDGIRPIAIEILHAAKMPR